MDRMIMGDDITLDDLLSDAVFGGFTYGLYDNVKRGLSRWRNAAGKGLEHMPKLWWMEGAEVADQAWKALPESIPEELVEQVRRALPEAEPDVVMMVLPRVMMEQCAEMVVGVSRRTAGRQLGEAAENLLGQGPRASFGGGSKPPQLPEPPQTNQTPPRTSEGSTYEGGRDSKKSSIPVPEKTKASNGLDYQSNPKHTLGQPGNRHNAGIEPQNSLELFGDSVQSTKKPNQRYTYDESTDTLHRFFNDGNGTWHWSGSTNQGQNSISGIDVPNDIKNIFNLPKKGW